MQNSGTIEGMSEDLARDIDAMRGAGVEDVVITPGDEAGPVIDNPAEVTVQGILTILAFVLPDIRIPDDLRDEQIQALQLVMNKYGVGDEPGILMKFAPEMMLAMTLLKTGQCVYGQIAANKRAKELLENAQS